MGAEPASAFFLPFLRLLNASPLLLCWQVAVPCAHFLCKVLLLPLPAPASSTPPKHTHI